MGVRRVDSLTDEQKAQFVPHADKWIETGLRTGSADRERFVASAKECYRHAGIDWPDNVVWVSSPMVLSIAAPAAAFSIALHRKLAEAGAFGDGAVRVAVDGAVHDAVGVAVDDAVRDAVRVAVHGAVDGAVRGAVGGAVDGAVRGAVGGAVRGAVHGAVGGAVDGAVHGAVHDAVRVAVDGAVDGAVHGAVDGAVGDAVRVAVGGAVGVAVDDAVREVIRRRWSYYIGGQLWAGSWWSGGAWTSFFRDVCDLELDGDMWDRARAYEGTIESACWWYPHKDFVMVCERPTEIHREQVDPARPRGWGSHRLHNTEGPAISFQDGWGLYVINGVRVTEKVVLTPELLTVDEINAEQNSEIRRVMREQFGSGRYLEESGAELIDEAIDELGYPVRLHRLPDDGDGEPLVMVEATNSTPEPDGHHKVYWLRVPPETERCRQALAWTFGIPETEYVLAAQS